MNRDTLQKIRKLVGPITAEQLQCIDCAVEKSIGIFIPSVGQCGYATTAGHIHPAYSLIITFDKESPVAPKGITPKTDEYGFTVMSPDIPHEEKLSDVFSRYVAVLIEPSTFENTWKQYSSEECGPFFWSPYVVSQSIMIHIKEFIAEFEAAPDPTGEVLHALGTCIIHTLVRSMLKINVSVDGISNRFEIQRAIELMHSRFGEKLSIPSLAKSVNRSVTHFSRLFKQETGLSPGEYFIRIRIAKAKTFLSQTAKNITEIALECGFSSTAHFSDTFKKSTGASPAQYRKSLQ